MTNRLQTLTQVAFLLLCLVGTAVGIKVLLRPDVVTTTDPMTDTASENPRSPLYGRGESIRVPGVDFSAADQTLLLVVRKGCRYCDESMPFYQALGADAAVRPRTRIVVAAPDAVEVSRDELQTHGVQVDQIVQVSFQDLKIQGTPTAILVTRRGIVDHVVPGLLDAAEQQTLLTKLRSVR